MSQLLQTIHVYYPSGTNFSVQGVWCGCYSINGVQFVLVEAEHNGNPDKKPPCMIFDPRGCFVIEETRAVLYTPRDHLDCMNKPMRDWMAEHPEWPAVLEL